MIVKLHTTQDGKEILAVCDENLLGKKIEEGNKQLDLTNAFYQGDVKSDQETLDIMRNCYILNLVGEKAIELAKKEEIISDENIVLIGGVPHAEAMLLEE